MDAPVSESTLRDLIPHPNSRKLDESSPLSASDLITLLDNITARSEGIKTRVHRTVTRYNAEFLHIVKQSNDAVGDTQNVAEQVQNVLSLLGGGDEEAGTGQISAGRSSPDGESSPIRRDGDGSPCAEGDEDAGKVGNQLPVDVEICQLAAEVQSLRRKVKEREDALVVVETVSSLHGRIVATAKQFSPGQLVEAAKNMVLVQEKLGLQDVNLEQAAGDPHHDVRVYKLLQDEWSESYNKLLGILEDLVSRAITVDKKRSELSVFQHVPFDVADIDSTDKVVELSPVLAAMDVLGVLDVRLVKFGDAIVRFILNPILKNSNITISTAVLASEPPSAPKCVLTWSPGSQNDEIVPEIVYPKIVQVTKFLNNHVLGGYDGLMARFGRTVWPRLADAIIARCLRKAIPTETCQLKNFEHVADLTSVFEKELASEGLISNFDPSRGDKLSIFASEVEIHFAVKKKKIVLASARDMLMQSEYTLPKSTWMSFKDEDSNRGQDRLMYLATEPCAVSLMARSLLEIVHEVLEDACLSTSRTALEFYHTSREVVMLYRAIIPLKLGMASDKLQSSALCYNDCLYIAYNLITLVYQYHEELPPSLKALFTFVDLVPLFRRMGEKALNRQLRLVQTEVMEAIDHANGFRHTDEKEQFRLALQSLEEVFDAFAHVSKHLRPILALSVYKKAIGRLINEAVRQIIQDVMDISDIGVQETLQLQKLLLIVQERFPHFLARAAVGVSAGEHVEEDELVKLVSLWTKLKTLTDILDMSLSSIDESWARGELASAGLSSSEVCGLVTAIFSDTPFRKECLQRIGSSM